MHAPLRQRRTNVVRTYASSYARTMFRLGFPTTSHGEKSATARTDEGSIRPASRTTSMFARTVSPKSTGVGVIVAWVTSSLVASCAGRELDDPPSRLQARTTTAAAVSAVTPTTIAVAQDARRRSGTDHPPRAPQVAPDEELGQNLCPVARRHDERIDVQELEAR